MIYPNQLYQTKPTHFTHLAQQWKISRLPNSYTDTNSSRLGLVLTSESSQWQRHFIEILSWETGSLVLALHCVSIVCFRLLISISFWRLEVLGVFSLLDFYMGVLVVSFGVCSYWFHLGFVWFWTCVFWFWVSSCQFYNGFLLNILCALCVWIYCSEKYCELNCLSGCWEYAILVMMCLVDEKRRGKRN